MAHSYEDSQPFGGFGIGLVPGSQAEGGVFILAVYRDGSLTATAHATERGAMEAALEYLDGEIEESDEGGVLEDYFSRVQRLVADEGGMIEIVPSPIHGG